MEFPLLPVLFLSESPVAATEHSDHTAVFADGINVHGVTADHEIHMDHGIVDSLFYVYM